MAICLRSGPEHSVSQLSTPESKAFEEEEGEAGAPASFADLLALRTCQVHATAASRVLEWKGKPWGIRFRELPWCAPQTRPLKTTDTLSQFWGLEVHQGAGRAALPLQALGESLPGHFVASHGSWQCLACFGLYLHRSHRCLPSHVASFLESLTHLTVTGPISVRAHLNLI